MKPLFLPENHTVYLVRHGLATVDPKGYGDKKLTARLLPQGIGAIEKIASYLKNIPNSCNLSSPLPRCQQTAAIITRITGKSFTLDKRLTEFYQEIFADFQRRIHDFTESLARIPQQDIIICSHSAVITGVQEFLTKGSFAYQMEYDYPREGELVIVRKGKSSTMSFNG